MTHRQYLPRPAKTCQDPWVLPELQYCPHCSQRGLDMWDACFSCELELQPTLLWMLQRRVERVGCMLQLRAGWNGNLPRSGCCRVGPVGFVAMSGKNVL
jgi:hypothetical protein